MVKNTYFQWMLDNLGYTFVDNVTLLKARKDILHNLYVDNPEDLTLLTTGRHGRFRRKIHEDWREMTHNNTPVMVCVRKFATNHGTIRLIDRSVEELKNEAERTYRVMKENGMI